MTTVRITDASGAAPKFTQWDVDRELIISGTSVQPMAHFENAHLARAIVVDCEASGAAWTCRVPNFILQFPLPFVVSVFIQEPDDQGLTVYRKPFGIVPKKKPQDYTYEENIGYINWVAKSEEVQRLIDTIQEMLDNGDLKGEPGSSGVYVGTTEPTDPNVIVWIDPSGPATPNASGASF